MHMLQKPDFVSIASGSLHSAVDCNIENMARAIEPSWEVMEAARKQ
jgi:hypothetical protein